jgi:hypothetical protein
MTSAVTSGEAPSGRLLGLGEALRSPVLLGGTVLAFECRRRLFGLILVACGPAAVTAGLGRVIEDAVDGTPRRLFAVGIACLATIALAAAACSRSIAEPPPSCGRRCRTAISIWTSASSTGCSPI